MPKDFVTIFSPLEGGTGKIIKANGKVQILPPAVWHKASQAPVADLAGLVRLLGMCATAPSRAYYAVRGELKPNLKARIRRTHIGEEASLVPAAHRWLLLDIDKYRMEVPGAEFAADPRAFAEQVRADLPAPFAGASCWYQATSSAGLKPGVRLRLAYWLSRPMGDPELKKWLKTWRVPLDTSLYTPSQPHFLANPLFEDPAMDPVRVRQGVLSGPSEVVLPEVLSDATEAEEELATGLRKIRRAQDGDRRNTVNTVTFHLARRFPELADETIHSLVTEAAHVIGQWPGSQLQELVTAAIKDGRAKGRQRNDTWRQELAEDKNGNPLATAANVSLYLEHHPEFRGKLAYNERDLALYWTRPAPWGEPCERKVIDTDATYGVEWFQTQAKLLNIRAGQVMDGMIKSGKLRSFDPIQQYLENLPDWDGAGRIDDLFIRTLGVDDTVLHRTQTAIAMQQAVRRAFSTEQAPAKADYVIVLQGKQGLRKSSTLKALCPIPRYFTDNLPHLASKDAAQTVADSWIVELSEMTHRKADQDLFKAFITRDSDKFRPPYGKDTITIPRRCVFFGSTNSDEIFTDKTGNRRFWPMECTRQASAEDLAWLEQNRDQLWAEAKHRAEMGEATYLPAELEAQAEEVQAAFTEEETKVWPVRRWLKNPLPPGHGADLEEGQLDEHRCLRWIRASQLLQLTGTHDNPYESGRIKVALREAKWSEKKNPNTSNKRVWYPPKGWTYALDQDTIRKGLN